ncbi:hypothetical protein BD408DRAFT_400118 [Parasitella parasitica]|nr:hypothetical protein BD408DRAFT_400118 [Parasitella parasitica]
MSENLLKLYLVRAEYRYFKWAYSLDTDFGSIKNAIPPLDIAFFWQAHMLSPLRFFEDSIRNSQLCHYRNIKMPLKEIMNPIISQKNICQVRILAPVTQKSAVLYAL